MDSSPPPYESHCPPPYSVSDQSKKQQPGVFKSSWQQSPVGQIHQPLHSQCYTSPPHTTQPHSQPVTIVVVDPSHSSGLLGRTEPPETYCRHALLACIVMWCFNCLFGLIAYGLASMAQNASLIDRTKARKLANASLKVSIIGIIISAVIAFVVSGVCHSTGHCRWPGKTNCTGFEIQGLCYSHRRKVSLFSTCDQSFENCCYPDEDMYYKRYCYTLSGHQQPATALPRKGNTRRFFVSDPDEDSAEQDVFSRLPKFSSTVRPLMVTASVDPKPSSISQGIDDDNWP